MEKYKDWDLLNEIPKGWVIDKTCGSPLTGYVFVTNGKSVLNGQKRALLRVVKKQYAIDFDHIKKNEKKTLEQQHIKKMIYQPGQAKTVNDLARQKFKLKILIDIKIDLAICDIEGWDKKEYINELKHLINSLI